MTSLQVTATTTARPSLLSAPLAWLARRRDRITDRRAFQTMLRLDEHLLNDIGVTRHDVLWASELPLSQNAAQELQTAAKETSR